MKFGIFNEVCEERTFNSESRMESRSVTELGKIIKETAGKL
jgi:hypothetical protein